MNNFLKFTLIFAGCFAANGANAQVVQANSPTQKVVALQKNNTEKPPPVVAPLNMNKDFVGPMIPQSLVPYIPKYTAATFDAREVNRNLAVGTIAGGSDVSSYGSATYSFSLTLPPGVGGSTPGIGLVYNNLGGNDHLGLGWSLTGLSVIKRDIKRRIFESQSQGVLLNNNAVYSLDDEHLLPITGTNGGNGTKYDTYQTNFNVIESKGSINGAPEWFEVVLKNGAKMVYGGTQNSRVVSANGIPVMWQLSKIIDTNGNYTEFVYFQGNTLNNDIDARLIEIRYSGNDDIGITPYNKVVFEYDDRTDKNRSYMPSTGIYLDKLLTFIKVYAGNTLVRQYDMSYSFEIADSYLSAIQETAFDTNGNSEKHNPTIFKYGDAVTSHYSTVASVGSPLSTSANERNIALDFNGDGYADLVTIGFRIENNIRSIIESLTVRLRDPNSENYSATQINVGNFEPGYDWIRQAFGNMMTLESVPTSVPAFFGNLAGAGISFAITGKPFANVSRSADFDGDGNEDVLFYNVTTQSIGELCIFWGRNTPMPTYANPFFKMDGPDHIQVNMNYNTAQGRTNPYYNPTLIGDFDGDGSTDILSLASYSNKFFLTDANTLVEENDLINPFTPMWVTFNNKDCGRSYKGVYNQLDMIDCRNAQYVLDFDGDGKDDLLKVKENGEIWGYSFEYFSDGTPYLEERLYTHYFSSFDGPLKIADFNGDGKADLAVNNRVGYSTGTYFTWSDIVPNGTLGDFNGDGRTDILTSSCSSVLTRVEDHTRYYTNTYKEWIHYSTGTGFNPIKIKSMVQYNSTFQNICNNAPPGGISGDFNGDGKTDLLNAGSHQVTYFNAENYRELTKVKDGMNAITLFDYQRLNAPVMGILTAPHNVGFITPTPPDYNPDNICNRFHTNQYRNFKNKVVTKKQHSNGLNTGTMFSSSYRYDAPCFSRGIGFSGFKEMTVKDDITNYETTTYLTWAHYKYRDIPLVKGVKTTYPNNQGLSYSENTYQFATAPNGRYWINILKTTTKNTLEQTMGLTEYTYDAFGNQLTIVSGLNNNAFKTEVTNTFGSFANGGVIPNKVISNTITKWRGSDAYTSKALYDYDASTGQLTQQTNYANLAASDQIKTDYTYNDFGNMILAKVTAPGLVPRYKQYTYDTKGRVALTAKNTLNQITFEIGETDINWVYGLPLKSKVLGVDGYTIMKYDMWGRAISTTSPLGIEATSALNWDIRMGTSNSIVEADNAVFSVHRTVSNSQNEQTTWFDLLGRARETVHLNFDGSPVHQVVNYDEKGNRYQSTMPFGAQISSDQISTVFYDDLNRPISTNDARGNTSMDYTFSGTENITTTHHYDGTSKTYKKDKSGALVEVNDQNGTLKYTYRPDGQPLTTTNNGQLVATMGYDVRDRQNKLVEPNAGTTTYAYDAFDQLLWQQDNAGNKYKMTYDNAGRILTHSLDDGSEQSNYEYIATGAGINNIKKVTHYNGVIDEFTYDTYGRIKQKKNTIDNLVDITDYGFDAHGRFAEISHNIGIGLKYGYNDYGYLHTVTDGSYTYFEANEMNAFGNYTNYIQVNGETTKKTFDGIGFPSNLVTGSGYNQNNEFDWQTGNLLYRYENAYADYNPKIEKF